MTHLGYLQPCNDTIGGNDMGTIPFILLSMLTRAHTRPAQTHAHTRRKKSETQRFEQINFSVSVYRHTLTIWGLSQDSREQIHPSSWKLRLREGGNPRDPHYQHHPHHHDTDGAALHSSWAFACGQVPRQRHQGNKCRDWSMWYRKHAMKPIFLTVSVHRKHDPSNSVCVIRTAYCNARIHKICVDIYVFHNSTIIYNNCPLHPCDIW